MDFRKILSHDAHLRALAMFTLAQAHALEARKIESSLAETLGITREAFLQSSMFAAIRDGIPFREALVRAGYCVGEVASRPPAVPIAESVKDEHIVCLEDGAKMQMLKRYLWVNFKMTPDDYRRKWGLPPNYPMTAPGYSAKRSDFAKAAGLGTSPKKKRELVAR